MIAVLLLLAQTEAILEESRGLVVFEAESVPPKGDWKLETSMAGFTGTGYVTWVGPDLFGAPGKDAVAWTFRVGRAGRYRLRIRNRHDFADSTLQNDCFTKMDEEPWIKTFSSRRGEWTWATSHELESGKPPASYELAAGTHVFRISGRSKGFSIDRIHLALEGAEGAEDAARPPSISLFEAMAGTGPYARLASLARKVRSGRGLGEVLRAARAQSADAEGQALSAALDAFAGRRLEEARAMRSTDPAECVRLLEELAGQFEGDERGAEAAKEAAELRADPAVEAELKAAAQWARVEQALSGLKPHNGARDLKSEPFRRLNAAALVGIGATCRQLSKSWPGTKGARRAEELLARLR
jgi:hypothetical protein